MKLHGPETLQGAECSRPEFRPAERDGSDSELQRVDLVDSDTKPGAEVSRGLPRKSGTQTGANCLGSFASRSNWVIAQRRSWTVGE